MVQVPRMMSNRLDFEVNGSLKHFLLLEGME